MNNQNYYLAMALAIIGVLLLVAAEPLIGALVMIFGIYTIFTSAYALFFFSRLIDDRAFKIESFVRGAAGLIIGILCVVLPVAVAEFAWMAIVYVLSFYVLASGITELVGVFQMKKYGIETKHYLGEALVHIAMAVILFMLPSDFGFKIIRIGGALLIIVAAVLAVNTMINNKNEIIVDAEEVE